MPVKYNLRFSIYYIYRSFIAQLLRPNRNWKKVSMHSHIVYPSLHIKKYSRVNPFSKNPTTATATEPVRVHHLTIVSILLAFVSTSTFFVKWHWISSVTLFVQLDVIKSTTYSVPCHCETMVASFSERVCVLEYKWFWEKKALIHTNRAEMSRPFDVHAHRMHICSSSMVMSQCERQPR